MRSVHNIAVKVDAQSLQAFAATCRARDFIIADGAHPAVVLHLHLIADIGDTTAAAVIIAVTIIITVTIIVAVAVIIAVTVIIVVASGIGTLCKD